MAEAVTNRDLLDWFSDAERSVCKECGERACVTMPDVPAHFCLACGAITLAGVRVDLDPTQLQI